MVKSSFVQPYRLHIIGEAVSTFSGPKPENIDALMDAAAQKQTLKMLYDIAEKEISLLCQKGAEGITEAYKVLDRLRIEQSGRLENGTYNCPINKFQRDKATGKPFIGAHYIIGAFRDAAADAFFEEWNIFKQGDSGKKKVGEAHLRKYLRVVPHHITMWRPNLDGEEILEVDELEGQQPSEKVKGFARYETIEPPFQFQFWMTFFPKGQFEKPLKNFDLVMATLKQAVNHGLGGRRAMGHGMWKLVSVAVEEDVVDHQDIEDDERGLGNGRRKRIAA